MISLLRMYWSLLAAKTRVTLIVMADLLFVFALSRLSVMLAMCFVVAQILTQVASFATTIFLHRYLTHEGITWLHPKLIVGFKFSIWLLTGIDWDEWVAVHLKHHAFADKAGDPHSPHEHGVWWLQVFNVYYYAREARNSQTVKEYAPHIQRYDGIWGHFPFSIGIMGPIIGTVALCLVMGAGQGILAANFRMFSVGMGWGLLTGGLHMVMYIGGSGSVNSLCHWYGYRNFENTATNLEVVAVFTAGEGEHNNHHGFPRSANFSATDDEIDLAWPVIHWMVRHRLATVYQSAINSMKAKAQEKILVHQGA